MVVFTCQHCNEALKKPVVEKHYSTKCRRNPYLTCVDCLKDFHGEAYVAHTTCVSEDQRYGGKDFKAKPVAVKQNSWVECVTNYLNENTNNPKYFLIFQKLKKHSNIPRKKSKFINFVSNGLNMKNTTLAEEIFDLFQKEFESSKGKNIVSEEKPVGKKDKKSVKTVSEPEEASSKVENGVSESNQNEKKRKKSKKNKNENVPEDDVPKKVNGAEKKKKHKKKNKKTDVTAEEEVTEAADVSVEVNNSTVGDECGLDQTNGTEAEPESAENGEKLSKKELKKLKKKQKYEEELKQIEVEKPEDEDIEDGDEESKSKKKKRKHVQSESDLSDQKKQKVNGSNDNMDNMNEIAPVEPDPKRKFDWQEVIKNVLDSSSDKEMSMKRLSKKVIAEYQTLKGERESYEELIGKFNKKVSKTPGVKVIKDKVKLVCDE